jgi:uracil DNA glycosylase
MTTEQKELDACHQILKLYQETLQQHEAYFKKMEEVLNAQARHIEVLETKVAVLVQDVYPPEVISAPDTL